MKVLITHSQGIGDEIMYAGALHQYAHDDVTLQCSKILWPVFARTFPNVKLVKRDKNPDTAGYDIVLRNDELCVPATNGFISVAPDAAFEAMLTAMDCGLKARVGLSWFSLNGEIGARKSATLQQLAALFTPDRHVVSLQYGQVVAEVVQAGFPVHVDHSVDQLMDMESYFAQVAACDTVVTISNTTAHVAGSIGKRTLLLVPGDMPDPLWYWDRMPYKSVTVYKGEGPQWATEALSKALRDL